MGRWGAWFVGLLGAGLGVGCGGPEGSLWVRLHAEGPIQVLDVGQWSEELECGVELDAQGTGVWLEWRLPQSAWWIEKDGSYSAERPGIPRLSQAPGSVLAMQAGGQALTYRPIAQGAFGKVEGVFPLGEGAFGLEKNRLIWRLQGGEKPSHVSFREFVPRGQANARGTQVSHDRVSGRGLSVWPGERWSLPTHIPEESALRFFCAARGGGDTLNVRFSVALEGEVLWELERPLGPDDDRWVELPLPAEGRRQATIELRVDGPPALTAFMEPMIGPARPKPRSIEEGRPNIVVFLADTFRADNLEVYGGAPEHAPALNALANESLVFERAWGTSPWTLPSQASLFTGLYPPEHSATRREYVLPETFDTLAEVLSRNGYRTAAVTDGAYISRRFHMNQGFDWFLEHDPGHWDLNETLARAMEYLENTDGRPIFLFLHTYRVHTPYRVGPEESPEEYHAFLKTIYHQMKRDKDIAEDQRQDLAKRFYDFYVEGLVDLDTEFGPWWQRLKSLPMWDPGYFVFTSDHGEAFYEHGKLEHGNGLYEESIRVPLLIHGPSLAPGVHPVDASLVDLPRTLAAIAGVTPSPDWRGVDLIAGASTAPILGFWHTRAHHRVALVDGQKKLIGDADFEKLRAGEVLNAYDLASDPDEQTDVGNEAAWPTKTARQHADLLRRILAAAPDAPETLSESERAQVLAELEAIGYTGD